MKKENYIEYSMNRDLYYYYKYNNIDKLEAKSEHLYVDGEEIQNDEIRNYILKMVKKDIAVK